MTEEPERLDVPVAPVPEVGSEPLARALAAGDVAAIGQALRHDVVVVPLIHLPDGETQTRVFEPSEGSDRPYELCLFSSAKTLALFLTDAAPDRDFALLRGPDVAPFLAQHHDVLDHVSFDPAGPHPMTASVDDVLAVLAPQPGDDDVAWLTGDAAGTGSRRAAEGDDGPADAPAAGRRVVGFELALAPQWYVLDLAEDNPKRRQKQVRELVRRQTAVLGDRGALLRADMRQWLESTAEHARTAGALLQGYLLQRSDDAALALSVTLYWHDLGPAIGETSHLDRIVEQIRAGLGPQDALVGAETAAGPFARHTRTAAGAAELDTARRPLLLADYWLQRPDDRGVVQIAFSTPHVDASEAILLLADNIVLRGAWVLEGD